MHLSDRGYTIIGDKRMRTVQLLVLFCLSFTLYAVCEFKGYTGYYHALPSLICAFLIVRHKLKLAEYF